jgi:hypothetical protein
MTATSVQAFFERTPYGRRSFLAGERVGSGELLSSALVRAATERGINPIVLLVTLQKERGLVSLTTAPTRHSIDYAFGCGCPDGGSCSTAYKGLDKQLACAADAFLPCGRGRRSCCGRQRHADQVAHDRHVLSQFLT